MATYFISYDLIKRKDYETLWKELKELGAKRILESVWWLKHDNTTCTIIRDHLKAFIDSDDRLVVIKSADWSSWCAKSTPNDA